jgi:hypothetical protein
MRTIHFAILLSICGSLFVPAASAQQPGMAGNNAPISRGHATRASQLQQAPTYRVLNSPYQHPQYDVRQRSPYAYGWFGSQDHTHWQRHFGYHRDFTQWSRR